MNLYGWRSIAKQGAQWAGLIIMPWLIALPAQSGVLTLSHSSDSQSLIGGPQVNYEAGALIVGVGSEASEDLYVQISDPNGDVCFKATDTTYSTVTSTEGARNYFDFPDDDHCDNYATGNWTFSIYKDTEAGDDNLVSAFALPFDASDLVRSYVPIGLYCYDDASNNDEPTCRCYDAEAGAACVAA